MPAQSEGADLSGRDAAARAGRRGRCRCCAGRRRRAAWAATRTRAAACRSIRRPRPTRLLEQLDANKDGRLDRARGGARPAAGTVCRDRRGSRRRRSTRRSSKASHDRADDQLPNLAIPELNSVGAQEIFVTAAHGVADFISAMDTDRIREWNAWYHLMNAGLPVKASGETDFPCMSGTRVGQGRSYVQLGKQSRVDYAQWCSGIARGRSYVSDGYAHALDFAVNGKTSGDELQLAAPGKVTVKREGRVLAGDAARAGLRRRDSRRRPPPCRRHGHQAGNAVARSGLPARATARRSGRERTRGGEPRSAGGRTRACGRISRRRSSAAAGLRCGSFPQLHTNPVNVLVAGKPIRASRESAQWALACIDQLWRVRARRIAPAERADAEKAYEEARAMYRRIAAESPPAR